MAEHTPRDHISEVLTQLAQMGAQRIIVVGGDRHGCLIGIGGITHPDLAIEDDVADSRAGLALLRLAADQLAEKLPEPPPGEARR